jgi:hypothetical protein
MKTIWMVLLLAVAAMAQQETKAEKPPKQVVQKLFVLKYADPGQLRELLRVFDATVSQSGELHALTVSAPPDAMRAIEEAIQKLDVPSATPKDVEMTVFLLVATDSAAGPAGAAIPKDIDSVVTQLKNTFPFKSYGLLDVIDFRTRTGQMVRATSSGGSLPMGNKPVSVITQISINSIAQQSDGSTLRVERLNAQIRVPSVTETAGSDVKYQYIDLQMQTDLDIKDGQKVVVGRLSLTHDQALFLVMMGKVL